jgi:TPR repeat protein
LVLVGLIVFVFFSGDRGASVRGSANSAIDAIDDNGTIERSLLVPPGMRARQYIDQLRSEGKPFPLSAVYEKADLYLIDGNLADAHLLYFFAARESHLPSMMKMGEMSDPTLFRAENSLLDNADVIQAYKWYQKAAAMGHQPALDRVASLQHWAQTESKFGNPLAKQLLLNF